MVFRTYHLRFNAQSGTIRVDLAADCSVSANGQNELIRKMLVYKNVEREIGMYAVRAYITNAVIDGHAVLSVSTSASEDATCCIRVMLGHPSDTAEGNKYTLESINHLLSSEPEIIDN